jgi:hypothetical protein
LGKPALPFKDSEEAWIPSSMRPFCHRSVAAPLRGIAAIAQPDLM